MIHEFRLSPPGSGRGLSCDADGAFLSRVPLLRRSADRWKPRDCGDLSRELSKLFGLPIDMSSKMGGLKAISNALNDGEIARAQIAAVLLSIPESPSQMKRPHSKAEMIKFIRDLHWCGIIKSDWDPDEHPRWPAGAPDSQGGQFAPAIDSDECGRGETIRRRWVRAKGEKWPTDSEGRNYDAHHIKPKADGGTDDPDNIRPMPHDEHVREHIENGDFSRWARRRRTRRKKEKPDTNSGLQGEIEGAQETESPDGKPSEPEQGSPPPDTKPKSDARNKASSPATAPRRTQTPGTGSTKPGDDGDERALEDTITIETLIEDILISSLL